MIPSNTLRKIYLEKLLISNQIGKLNCGLRVVFNNVLIFIWQKQQNKSSVITYKYDFQEFLTNQPMIDLLNCQIGTEFVRKMVVLLKGATRTLSELPDNFLKKLIDYLTLKDLLNLSSTCKYFFEFYTRNDEIWIKIFEKFLKPICTFYDYEDGIRNGGFHRICRKTCIKNSNHPIVTRLLGINSTKLGGSSNFHYFRFTNDDDNDESGEDTNSEVEESNGFWKFKFQQKSENDKKNDTKETETSPSSTAINSSFLSLTKRLEKLKISEDDNKPPNNENKKYHLYFTRRDLQRRMERLRIKTEKFICEEDSLPGDKTIKYSLKYREETLS